MSNIWSANSVKLLDVPNPRRLDSSDKEYPYIFLGDEAFSLRTNLINSYSKHSLSVVELLVHCKTSGAGRVVDKTFGIATSRFCGFVDWYE